MLSIHGASTRGHSRKAARLGLVGGLYAHVFGRRLPPIMDRDLRKRDFSTSTQRMGVGFTDRIRDMFRFRWVRRAR